MKLLKISKKWFLLLIGLLLVVFILKCILFFTVQPQITVNYVAEYNKTSKPENYNPEENAVIYYQQASGEFVYGDWKRKCELMRIMGRCNWSADLYDIERVLLENWLLENSKAFEYFHIGASKPYWWAEGSAKDNIFSEIQFPKGSFPSELIRALIWDAKLKAVNGELKLAFENILTCYKAGKHLCRPNLLLVRLQQEGLYIKRNTIDCAFIILDRVKVESEALKFLQDSLQQEIDNDTYVPSLQTEKFLIYDDLQRSFIDNRKGTGRTAIKLIRRLFVCLMGPRKNEMEKLIEVNTLIDKMMIKTPWEISAEWSNYYKQIQKIWDRKKMSIGMRLICRIIPTICIPSPENWSLFHLYYETKAKTEALITTLAILRFKNDHNRLPENLEEVVSEGYLKSLPNDPYSDGPLVYKLTEDDFLLYSVGKDFIDDGGVARPPGPPTETSYDIIYWPVRLSPPWPVRPKSQ